MTRFEIEEKLSSVGMASRPIIPSDDIIFSRNNVVILETATGWELFATKGRRQASILTNIFVGIDTVTVKILGLI